MSYILRHTRMVYSKKLPDRFLHCAVVTGSDAQVSGKRGTIISLIEIKSPWYQINQLGQKIANHLAREYFRGVSSSDINNFENAIKSVNELVAEAELESDKDWYQRTNAFLGLVIDNDVHFTQIGEIYASIKRNEKILKVSTPETSAQTTPDALFSSLTSGSLEDDDFLVIGTKKLLSNEFSYQYPLDNPAELAGQIIASRPKKEHDFCAVVMQVNDRATLADKEAKPFADTIYLDQSIDLVGKRLQHTLHNSFIPWLKTSSQNGVRLTKSGYQKLDQKVKPVIKQGSSKLNTAAKQKLTQLQQKTAQKEPKATKEQTQSANDMAYKVNYYNQQSKKIFHKISLKTLFIFRRIKRLLAKQKWLNLRNKNKYALYAGALLFILFVAAAIKYNSQPDSIAVNSLTKQIELSEAASDEARNANLYGDKDKARSILTEQLAALDEHSTAAGQDERYQNIYQRLSLQLDELDKVIRLSPTNSIEAPKNGLGFVVADGRIWLVDKQGDVYNSPAAGGSLTTTGRNIGTVRITGFSERASHLYAIGERGLSVINLTNQSITTAQMASTMIAEATDVTNYNHNIYITTNQGQVNRYALRGSNLEDEFSFVANPKNAIVKVAIDGSIYALTPENQLQKIDRRSVQDLEIAAEGKSLELARASGFFTSPEREFLYVSIGSKLIVLDKSGKFINQYAFDEVTKIDAFFMHEKGASIWILTGEKIMQFNLR